MAEDLFVGVTEAEEKADATEVTLERRDDGVAVIRLNRPKANALSAGVLALLKSISEELTARPPGAVVVWGGPGIFAAGADLAELGATAEDVVGNFHGALRAVANIPRITVAAVNGYALGGGLELALACDLRICADNSRLGLPEINLGVIPGGGGTQRLPRLVGAAWAKDMILTGREVLSDEALRLGLVNRVVPAAEVFDAALEMAGRFARGPLVAQVAAKSAIDRGLEGTLDQGLNIERSAFSAVARTQDAARGIASFQTDGPGKAKFIGK